MTVAFAAFLIVFGSHVRPYDSPAGQVALLVVVGMFTAGFAWLRRLSAADPADAYLARPGRPAWTNPADVRLVTGLTGLSAQAHAVRADPGAAR
jgi:hypothetical protein